MLEILRARLAQIAPELVPAALSAPAVPVVPNPVQLDPIVDEESTSEDL
jgi:hypothetical protein